MKNRDDWTFREWMSILKFHKDCDKLLGALIYEEISNYEKETKKTTLFGNSNEVTTFETEAMEMAHHNAVTCYRLIQQCSVSVFYTSVFVLYTLQAVQEYFSSACYKNRYTYFYAKHTGYKKECCVFPLHSWQNSAGNTSTLSCIRHVQRPKYVQLFTVRVS